MKNNSISNLINLDMIDEKRKLKKQTNWILGICLLCMFVSIQSALGLPPAGKCDVFDDPQEMMIADNMSDYPLGANNASFACTSGNCVYTSEYFLAGNGSAKLGSDISHLNSLAAIEQDCVTLGQDCILEAFFSATSILTKPDVRFGRSGEASNVQGIQFVSNSTIHVFCNDWELDDTGLSWSADTWYHVWGLFNGTTGNAAYYVNETNIWNCTSINTFGGDGAGADTISVSNAAAAGYVYYDRFNFCNVTDLLAPGAPNILFYNCTSCDPPNGDNESPYTTDDTTPTFNIITNKNALCRISNADENYTTMGTSRNCSPESVASTNHVCTLKVQDEITVADSYVYISCIDEFGYENKTSNSGPLHVQIRNNENSTDEAILHGIHNSSVWPGATIYVDQQVYVRDLNNNQAFGTFDYVAVYENQRWGFNFISDNETSIGSFYNLSPIFYFLEMSLSGTTITSEVSKLINQTKI